MGCCGACSMCGASCGSGGLSPDDRRILLKLEEKIEEMTSILTGVPAEQHQFMDEAHRTLARMGNQHPPSASGVPASHDTEISDTLLRSGRSVTELQRATDGDLDWDASGKWLVCKVCAPALKYPKKSQAGVFQYDAADGVSFEPSAIMTQRFKSLKQHINEHFRSARHRETKKAQLEKTKKQEARTVADRSAALHVLRSTYLVLKHSIGHTIFEQFIVAQHLNGTLIGNLNHSRMMVATARSVFNDVILEKLKQHITRQPCIAVLADKVTIARRTVDITAVLTLLPTANEDEVFQAFVIGAPVVKRHDGESLAAEIKDTLEKVGVVSTEQLAAIATDGQYHHNDVPAKLSQMMNGPSCVPAVWDHAHLMNLAEADARKAPEMVWVTDTVDIITSVNTRFSTGKGMEELLDSGKDRGQKTHRPKFWSETRFAPHAAQVLSVFRRNMPALTKCLEDKLRAQPRHAKAEEMREELSALKDASFEARVRALEDIYLVLSTYSKAVQSTQALPWERQASQEKVGDQLERMRLALVAQHKKKTTAELLRASEMEDLWPTLHKSRSPQSLAEATKVARFCTTLKERLEYRGGGCDKAGSKKGTSNSAIADSMADIRCAADLQQLAASRVSPGVLARQVREAGLRLADRKLVPPSAVPLEEQVVAGIAILRENTAKSNAALWKLLCRHEGVARFQKYVDFVCRLWLLSPPESVVESMASVIGEVFGEHRQLAHTNAAKELVVRWNGPNVCNAGKLLRIAERRLADKVQFHCTRRTTSIAQAFEGTVISRHLRAPDASARLWDE